MSLYIPGTTNVEDLVRFDWDLADPVIAGGSKPTVEVGMWRFIPRNIVTSAGDTTHRLAGVDDASNGGLQTQIGTGGSSAFYMRVRTTSTNAHSSANINATLDSEMWFAYRIDYVAGELKFFHNGAQLGDDIILEEGDSWRGDGFRPMIRGRRADSKDIEWEEIAYWNNSNDLLYANADNYVPTGADLLAYTSGADVTLWAAPKSHVRPTGANGAFATSFADLTPGGRVFNLTTGQTSGPFAPYFISSESPILTSSSIETTAKTATVGFASSAGTGTAYIVGAVTGTFSAQPDPEDIAAGLLDDGVTAATYADSLDMTGQVTGEFIFSDLAAITGLDFYIVQDTDDAGDYSNALYISGSTKRPVIVPATTEKRLLDAGEPVISETGMTMWILGAGYSQAGHSTDGSGLFELDLTEYLNTTGTEDIGDTVDIVLTLADGERGIVAMGQTITEGE